MTNLEKFYKEIIFDGGLIPKCKCYQLRTGNVCDCHDSTNCEVCQNESEKWLQEEYVEHKLDNFERALLDNIGDKWEWIARDANGDLHLFDSSHPVRIFKKWDNKYPKYDFTIFNGLFKMVSCDDEEATLISELKKQY